MLGTEWEESVDTNSDKKPWSGKATVKIFNDEEEYKKYQNGQEKSIDSDSDENSIDVTDSD